MSRFAITALVALSLGCGAASPSAQDGESGAILDAPPHGSPLARLMWDVQDESWRRCGGDASRPVHLTLRRDQAGNITVVNRASVPPGGAAACLADSIARRRAPHPDLRAGVVNRVAFPWPEVHGGFDASVVVQGIRERLRSMTRCYEQLLRYDRSLAGKVVARFTITEHGRVTHLQATENTSGHPAVAACVTEKLAAMELPDYPVGGPVEFSYPFVFAPQDRERRGGPR